MRRSEPRDNQAGLRGLTRPTPSRSELEIVIHHRMTETNHQPTSRRRRTKQTRNPRHDRPPFRPRRGHHTQSHIRHPASKKTAPDYPQYPRISLGVVCGFASPRCRKERWCSISLTLANTLSIDPSAEISQSVDRDVFDEVIHALRLAEALGKVALRYNGVDIRDCGGDDDVKGV